MKGGGLFKKIIYSSVFLALIPFLIIFIFLPSLSSKYNLSVEPGASNRYQVDYSDLDSDSVSEVISSNKGIPYFYIVVQDYKESVFDQWNLSDSLDPKISGFFFGNYDNDFFREIYIFSKKGDSLFLNMNEFREPSGTKLERIYITKISSLKGEVTSNMHPAGFFDENGDGFNELYFIISTGFGLQPRRAYYYDIVHNELRSSQFTGIIGQFPKFVDSDGDSRPEIFGRMSASGNYKTRVQYSDSSTWLMVFNDQLEFEFPPVEFPGYTNHLEINAYSNGKFKGYLLSHGTAAMDTTVLKPQIMLYSSDGRYIRSRLYSGYGFKKLPELTVLKHKRSDRIYLFGEFFIELNDNLEVVSHITSPFKTYYESYYFDIDFDGEEEILLYSENEEKLVVYGSGMQKLTEIKFKAPDVKWKISHYLSKDHKHRVFLSSADSTYFLTLERNNYYYLGYLAYPGIYLLLYLFIFLIKRATTLQIEQRERLKRRLLTLQLQGIKSQLDPHFTFNALNSVASLVYMDDRQAAYDYLNKFTQLIRRLLNDAERIFRSLGEELEFVTTYLDLERLRFGDKFNYEIKIGEGVTRREQVPKLVLQTFTENAIKHGIMPREVGGMLRITVEKDSGYLLLTVEDNGIGRAEAAGRSTSTGKGLKLTDEFYEILNKVSKRPLKFIITDLYDYNGDPAGTRVEVWVPEDV